jgi:DNA-binding NarL/FixJ family response regulator
VLQSVLLVASELRRAAFAAWFSETVAAGQIQMETCSIRRLQARIRHGRPAGTLLVDMGSEFSCDELRSIVTYVRRFWPQSYVLVVGGGTFAEVVVAARAGAQGCLTFGSGAGDVSGVLADVRAHGFALPPGAGPTRSVSVPGAAQFISPLPGFTDLTTREKEVARLMALGMTNGEIGVRLGIRPETAKWHAKHVLNKLGVHGRTRLAALWHGSVEYRQSAVLPRPPSDMACAPC